MSKQTETRADTGCSLQRMVRRFFEQNPEYRDGVMKAYHAYHVKHFRCDPTAHNFANSRQAVCLWCGRSREEVRWDNLPPQCQKRPALPEIQDVIFGEERKALALLKKAERDIPKLVAKLGMSGETLAMLHHTYGYDPETVTMALEGPHSELALKIKGLMADYDAAMEKERTRSRAAQVKQVITLCDA